MSQYGILIQKVFIYTVKSGYEVAYTLKDTSLSPKKPLNPSLSSAVRKTIWKVKV